MRRRPKITILDADSREFTEYVNSQKKEGMFALCFEEDVPFLQVPYISLGKDETDQAKHLFAALRELDERGAQEVYAAAVHPNKEWVLRCIIA